MRARLIWISRWLLRAGVSAGLIYLLLRHAEFGELADHVAGISLGWFAIATLIKGAGILAGIIRWRLLLAGLDLRFSAFDLGGAYLIGRFFGSFLPSTIGLDGYRTYYAAVRSREAAHTIAVTAVEKLIGLLALSLLALAAMALSGEMLPARYRAMLAGALCVPILLSALMLARPTLFGRIARWFRGRGGKISTELAKMSDAVARFGEQKKTLGAAVLLGLVVHGGTSAMYIATAKAVGAEIAWAPVLAIGPLMIAATLVPLSIAGIGVREATYVFFLAKLGVPAEQAALLGFLGFMAGEVYSLTGGVVWALRPASRPEEGLGLLDVVRRAADWAGGRKPNPEAAEP